MAFEGPSPSVATPEQELAYLREQIAQKERELAALKETQPREQVAHERILHHRAEGAAALAPGYALAPEDAKALALELDPESDDETIDELRALLETKGIKNAFAVLEQLNSPHIEDDFHRFLVQYLVKGMPIQGLSEKQPAWKSLHMTLYEIALPELADASHDKARPLKELLSAMEQFYAGMSAVEHAHTGEPAYYTLELAVPVDRAHLMFYAAVPNSRRDLFEKQVLAIFPNAHIAPQPNDYNVFVQDGASAATVASFAHPSALPLKDYAEFDYDPLNSLLNAFAKIAPEGEGASLQIVIRPQNERHTSHFRRILDALRRGEAKYDTLRMPESLFGEAVRDLGITFFKNNQKMEADRERRRASNENQTEIEQVERKLATPLVSVNMRLAVSSRDPHRAEQILGELEASFHQYENPSGNRISWKRITAAALRRLFHDFSFRLFDDGSELPLSLRELTTLYHFPPQGIESSPHLKQARFAGAAAPLELPREGLFARHQHFPGPGDGRAPRARRPPAPSLCHRPDRHRKDVVHEDAHRAGHKSRQRRLLHRSAWQRHPRRARERAAGAVRRRHLFRPCGAFPPLRPEPPRVRPCAPGAEDLHRERAPRHLPPASTAMCRSPWARLSSSTSGTRRCLSWKTRRAARRSWTSAAFFPMRHSAASSSLAPRTPS